LFFIFIVTAKNNPRQVVKKTKSPSFSLSQNFVGTESHCAERFLRKKSIQFPAKSPALVATIEPAQQLTKQRSKFSRLRKSVTTPKKG